MSDFFQANVFLLHSIFTVLLLHATHLKRDTGNIHYSFVSFEQASENVGAIKVVFLNCPSAKDNNSSWSELSDQFDVNAFMGFIKKTGEGTQMHHSCLFAITGRSEVSGATVPVLALVYKPVWIFSTGSKHFNVSKTTKFFLPSTTF